MPISIKIALTGVALALMFCVVGAATIEYPIGQAIAKGGLVFSMLVVISAGIYQIWS